MPRVTVVGMVLEAFTEVIGCVVVRRVPASGYWGEYDAIRHEVRLHPRLSGIQAKAVLAHELGHAAYRHERSTAQTEREANEISDWLRIPFCAFMHSIKVHETTYAVAHELDVLPSEIRRYAQRLLLSKKW